MKRIIALSTIVLCTACAAPDGYAPLVQNPPKNHEKFLSDVAACKEAAKPTTGETVGLVLFGGLADVAMVAAGNNRMVESESARIDDCMKEKGYILKGTGA